MQQSENGSDEVEMNTKENCIGCSDGNDHSFRVDMNGNVTAQSAVLESVSE